MLTRGAITDIIASYLARAAGRPACLPPPSRKVPEELPKKIFLSDYDLRKLRVPGGRSITVPHNAILSPLALDWIEFNGISVLRSGS